MRSCGVTKMPGSTDENLTRLRILAEKWRAQARDAVDPYYIALMLRTADDIERQIAELEKGGAFQQAHYSI